MVAERKEVLNTSLVECNQLKSLFEFWYIFEARRITRILVPQANTLRIPVMTFTTVGDSAPMTHVSSICKRNVLDDFVPNKKIFVVRFSYQDLLTFANDLQRLQIVPPEILLCKDKFQGAVAYIRPGFSFI